MDNEATPREKSEQEQLPWFWHKLDEINQFIQQQTDSTSLLTDLPALLLSLFDVDRAWVASYRAHEIASWTVLGVQTRGDFEDDLNDPFELPPPNERAVIVEALCETAGPVVFDSQPTSTEILWAGRVGSFVAMAVPHRAGAPWIIGIERGDEGYAWTETALRLLQEVRRWLIERWTTLQLQEKRATASILKRVQHISLIGSWTHDLIPNQITLNDRLMHFLDQAAPQVEYEAFLQHIHDADRPLIERHISQASEDGQPVECQCRLVISTGEIRQVFLHIEPVKNESAEVVALSGRLYDVIHKDERHNQPQITDEWYRVFTESAITGIYLIQNGRFSYVNPAMSQMLGFELHELLGAPAIDFVHPDDRQTVIGNLRRRIEGDVDTIRYGFRGMNKDGAISHFEVHGRRIVHNGQLGVLGTLVDVTARKRSEEALAHSRAKEIEFQNRLSILQSLTNQLSKAENTDELCREAVLQGRESFGFDRLSIWFVDQSAETLLGSFGIDEQGKVRDERAMRIEFRPEGMAWEVYSRRESMVLVDRHIMLSDEKQTALKKGEMAVAGLWDGDQVIGVIFVDNYISQEPITDQQLEMLRLYAANLGHLITRKRAEEALLTSEMRYRELVDHAADAFFLQVDDGLGTIIDVNPQASESLGYTREELIGMSTFDFVIDLDDEILNEINEQLDRGEVVIFESMHKRKDGTVFPVEVRSRPFVSDGRRYTVSLSRDISERLDAERALTLFRTLLDKSIDSIEIIDMETGRFLDANEAAYMTLGYTREEFLQLTVEDVNPNVKKRGWPKTMEMLRNTGSLISQSFHQRKDGSIFPIEINISYIQLDREYVLGVVRDITERKATEDALREREIHAQALLRLSRKLEQAKEYADVMDAGFEEIQKILGYNNLWISLLSQDRETASVVMVEGPIRDKMMASNVTGSLPTRGDDLLEEIFNSKEIVIVEDAQLDPRGNREISKKYGNRTIVNVPMMLYDNQIGSMGVGTYFDEGVRIPTPAEQEFLMAIASHFAVTLDRIHSLNALERTNQALQESEEKYRLIAENTVDMIGVYDMSFQPIYISPSVHKLRGYTVDEALTQPLDQLLPAASLEKIKQLFSDTLTLGKTVAADLHRTALLELELPHQNEGMIWVELAVSVLRNKDNQPAGILTVTRNISERKQAEEAIYRLNQDLERRVAQRTAQLAAVNQELEAFAYSVSHDLRAPLRHIDGFLELFQKRIGGDIDAKAKHYIDTISGSARRMGQLIDDLLSFSRMGRYELARSTFDLSEVLNEVLHDFQPEMKGRDIHWTIAELPAVSGDAAMMRQVFANLISNALKFTQGREVAEIEVGCQIGDRDITVFVRDNGVGFDMAYVDKLFGVFQRLHHSDEFEGTGIGLANIRRIINRHGGQTWAEGEIDRGATFYFSLPYVPF